MNLRRIAKLSFAVQLLSLAAFFFCLTVPQQAAIVSSGDVTPPLPWVNTTNPRIGNTGSGSLAVDGGSTLATSTTFLGFSLGAFGEATITGAGSKWTNRYELYVGRDGSGKLTVMDGGIVTTENLYASLSDLHGNGTLTATKGAVLDADFLFDATHGNQNTFQFGSGGNLKVTASYGILGAGYKGLGSLTVADGIGVSSEHGYLGYKQDATGEARITGPGSRWFSSSTFSVGLNGQGNLRVENGGEVKDSLGGSLGHNANATGTATITGTGSKWTNGSIFYVGGSGNGILLVENGGQVTDSVGYVAQSSGSIGMATIAGHNSKWINANSLYVGDYGNGLLRLEDGGQVSNTTGFLSYDWNSTSDVTITGQGSLWTNTSNLYVGYYGSATLHVENGGQGSNVVAFLGFYSGSTGNMTITGQGSKWTNSSNSFVGFNGTGMLCVVDGGQVTSTSSFLGFSQEAMGEATVSGPGSKWTIGGALTVGRLGSGKMSITHGGLVTVGSSMTIDLDTDGDSFLDMSAGGMLALWGDADDSLVQFLNLVQGTDAIRYWDDSLADWAPIVEATPGVDYTLQYLTEGELAGFTLLTVGTIPEPSAGLMLGFGAAVLAVGRCRRN